MSCRLPGANNLDEFWQLLVKGEQAVSEMPPSLLNRDIYWDSRKGKIGRTYATIGGLIKAEPGSPKADTDSRERFDECHELFFQVAKDACAHAGYRPEQIAGRPWAVYVGHSAGSSLGGQLAIATLAEQIADLLQDLPDFAALSPDLQRRVLSEFVESLRKERPQRELDGGPLLEAHWCATLLSQRLKLTGPAAVVDAACASSLVALALSIMALRSGQVEAAIVGGASQNKLESLLLFSQAQSCSATASRPFDESADGLVGSEGYVALLLKTHQRAIEDGDTVYGLIQGLGISSDGRGRSLWAPNSEGQKAALERAYGGALDPARVQYIEAHATSTQVGDATEMESLNEFFRPHLNHRKVPIGSVKSNLGHTLETAGLASIVKVLLAMQNGCIPASINITKLNQSVDWDSSPFEVATQNRDWNRPDGSSRCAGISAFGIGGLNVHLFIEQTGIQDFKEVLPNSALRVAVVGTGIAVAGAGNTSEFQRLLEENSCQLREPSEKRWRKRIGIKAGKPEPGCTTSAVGGYIEELNFDCVKHKVAPRLYRTGNPLQFMLLSATEEALQNITGRWDPRETAVVVGTSFGGEFSDKLTLGLRFPEIRLDLNSVLEKHQVQPREDILNAYEDRFFEEFSSLYDETGGFTSSTLASRLAKSYNLMGGALALDGGQCSSHLAIKLGCDLIQNGVCSTVVCAGGQSSLNLVGFEHLSLQGRLGPDGFYPGEGAGVVVLRSLSQALQDENPILAVIEGSGAAFGPTDLASANSVAKALASSGSRAQELGSLEAGCGFSHQDEAELAGISQRFQSMPLLVKRLGDLTGHLGAAHGVASVIRACIERPKQARIVAGLSSGGQSCCLVIASPTHLAMTQAGRLRFSGKDLQELRGNFLNVETTQEFAQSDQARMQILWNDRSELLSKLKLCNSRSWDQQGRLALQDHGIFIAPSQQRGRIAFVFSGQGSQYAGMLDQWTKLFPAAAEALCHAERALFDQALPSFESLTEPEKLHSDPVCTQLAVLVSDYVIYQAVKSWGILPACVSGHSFGEIPALLAADVLSLEDAISLTVIRARALLAASPDGGLLSIKLPVAEVRAIVQQQPGLNLFVTHVNSPTQTVLGGKLSELEILHSQLRQKGVASRMLNVPGALHTPLVESARAALSSYLDQIELRPPTKLFYSGVTNQPCNEPSLIRKNLLDQLVQPVQFMQLQDRLYADGVRAFIEIGPGQVLTQLMRSHLQDRDVLHLCVDHPQKLGQQLARIEAALETWGLRELSSNTDLARLGSGPEILEFDATQGRRGRRRSEPRQPLEASPVETTNEVRSSSPVFKFLLDYLVDITGFEAASIDHNWDLEADLGIDSIKRAQIFGEIRDTFSVVATDQQLAQLRTLNQIVAFVDDKGSVPLEPIQEKHESADGPVNQFKYELGLELGRKHSAVIKVTLRQAALANSKNFAINKQSVESQFSPDELSLHRGIADGAGLHVGALLAYETNWGRLLPKEPSTATLKEMPNSPLTRRYLLRVQPSAHPLSRANPNWAGGAIILGSNQLATELGSLLVASGCPAVEILDAESATQALIEQLNALWKTRPFPHLFLATPHDQEALGDWNWDKNHRKAGLETPFWFCREWLIQVKASQLMQKASLLAFARLDGHFATTGRAAVPESGALSGLLKSISIESWVSGHRDTIIKILDCEPTLEPREIAKLALLELANPSHDREICFVKGERWVLSAVPESLPQRDGVFSGNWICTGGARGITAHVSRQLAKRFPGITLHLIGKAPMPQVSSEWKAMWPKHRAAIKLQAVEKARALGIPSIPYWEETEKALEIDQTLRCLLDEGIQASYYSCDIADAQALSQVLETIRASGPVLGILHGAGIGRDCKYEHKEPVRVEACFQAKIDGTLNLMRLTQADPLKYFIAFGSISGRFGANGHADYSLANDMLAKLVTWYRQQRPGVGAMTFHWHAWGDIGMAVKGGTELGLEQIDIKLMPAQEGVEHLITELCAGVPESEILITTPAYYRQFFASEQTARLELGRPILGQRNEVWLDPRKETFLRDHRSEGVAVLPLAVALQMLWEAVSTEHPSTEIPCLTDIEALTMVKFFGDSPRCLRVNRVTNSDKVEKLELTFEFKTRTGQVVEANRVAVVAQYSQQPGALDDRQLEFVPPEESCWEAVRYLDQDAFMYHGPSLRALRSFHLEPDKLWGRLTAPSLVELAGSHRDPTGWQVPSAALDACFYAVGILAWHAQRAAQSVPHKLEALEILDLPYPGESCLVQVTLELQDASGAVFNFALWGHDSRPLLRAKGYRVAWSVTPAEVGV